MSPETKSPRQLFDIDAGVAYLRSLGAESATKNFLRSLISSGAIPYVRIGKRFYCSRESLDRWVLSHERRARP